MTDQSIAPHQGREISLVLNGSKRFAVIEKRKDLASYFAAGSIRRKDVTVQYVDGPEGPEVILTTNRKLVAEYESLLRDGVSRLGIKEYHRAVGRLFGYSENEINAFIDSEIDCNCSKCNGVKNGN